jgi:hypothetical protein
METRKLAEITPYDRNPRKNDGAVDRVLESLNRHGQVKPIVLSAKGKPFAQETVVAGHTTLRALERFGAKEAFVVVKEFADEAQFIDYNIRDNKSGEFAEWDEQELANLSAEFDISLDEMGFDIVADSDEFGEDFTLPDGDKEPFQQMTFTLADAQAELIKEALGLGKSLKAETHGNENGNGNALFAIVEAWKNGQS